MASPTVLGAVTALLKADLVLTALVPANRIWSCQAPDGTSQPPMIEVEHLGEEPLLQTEYVYLEATDLRVTAYATRAEDAEAMIGAVKDVLDPRDDFALDVEGADFVGILRGRYQVRPHEDRLDRAATGAIVFKGVVDYTVRVQRQKRSRR